MSPVVAAIFFIFRVFFQRVHVEFSDCMVKRLRDSEWEVRQTVLLRLTEVASEEPEALSQDAYSEMVERMKDRKGAIRRSAMLCLARLYARHVSGRFFPVNEIIAHIADKRSTILQSFGAPLEVWSLLNRVPGYIVSCWGYPEFIDRQLVLQLLQEYLIPRYSYSGMGITSLSGPQSPGEFLSSPDAADMDVNVEVTAGNITGGRVEAAEAIRATALLALWSTLDQAGRSGLAGILGFKTKARKSLGDFLTARTGSGGVALRKRMLHLLSVLVPQDKKHFTSDSLNSSK